MKKQLLIIALIGASGAGALLYSKKVTLEMMAQQIIQAAKQDGAETIIAAFHRVPTPGNTEPQTLQPPVRSVVTPHRSRTQSKINKQQAEARQVAATLARSGMKHNVGENILIVAKNVAALNGEVIVVPPHKPITVNAKGGTITFRIQGKRIVHQFTPDK